MKTMGTSSAPFCSFEGSHLEENMAVAELQRERFFGKEHYEVVIDSKRNDTAG